MKITAIRVFPVCIPLKPERRMISALGRHEVSPFVLIRVETDAGDFGVGEATVTPRWSGETMWGATALIEHILAPVLLGVDPSDHVEIDRRMDAVAVDNWFAKSAIEMACWDICGKAAGQPVYQLLGGAQRGSTIRNRFSIGAYAPDIAAARATERVAVGFDTIKVKVGTVPEEDVARVQAVRQAIGPNITLTIDANGGWTAEQARWSLERLANCNVALVEQPLIRGNYTELRELRRATGCRILADESCFDEIHARELFAQECCDVLSLYPGKQGGIRKAMKIAKLAEEHGIPCSIGSNLEWDVGAATMLHFIIATKNMDVEHYPGDCLGPFYHEVSIAKNLLQITGPFTTLNDGPGLGIEVDWDVVTRYSAKVG